MPRQISEMYEVLSEPVSATSTGTGNVQTISPPAGKRAIGAWVSCETIAARMTFSGATPGVSTGPGLVIPVASSPIFFPFPFGDGVGGHPPAIQFASNAAGNSLVTVLFVI